MISVLEAPYRVDDPTEEQFVDAVMAAHARIQSGLRSLTALAAGEAARRADRSDLEEPTRDEELIRLYFTLHGVDAEAPSCCSEQRRCVGHHTAG